LSCFSSSSTMPSHVVDTLPTTTISMTPSCHDTVVHIVDEEEDDVACNTADWKCEYCFYTMNAYAGDVCSS
jgi:hypothetical protein